jgi:N-acetylmuramate 1-kinase
MGSAMAVPMTPPAAAPAFLANAGWGGAEVVPLAGDASFRRYFRVVNGDRRAVLMDAPPPHEDAQPFVNVATFLHGIDLRAPEIFARDMEAGLLLIEDFGDNRMREAVDANLVSEPEIYRGAVDVLIDLHRHAPPDLPRHGLENWLNEVSLFTDWYCPQQGLQVDHRGFREAWAAALAPIDTSLTQWVMELRDYHAENVMLTDGVGNARFGLLDFQDARIGHPAYDLVSMLQDARRDVSPSVEAAMLAHYKAQTGHDSAFDNAYWALGGQRNTRILGVFVRLWKRDGKEHYRRFQTRMWGLLERDLAHPSLSGVKAWFDSNIPADARGDAWVQYV